MISNTLVAIMTLLLLTSYFLFRASRKKHNPEYVTKRSVTACLVIAMISLASLILATFLYVDSGLLDLLGSIFLISLMWFLFLNMLELRGNR